MLRYRVSEPALLGEEKAYVLDCLDKVELSTGEYVSRFENKLVELFGVKSAISCNNGTAALHLALLALGLRPGDEVVVPTLTFIATANAVHYTGAKPIFVDSDETWCMDADQVLDELDEKTAAVIPVHVYGQPCDMDRILGLGIPVVVDAAEAQGACDRGRLVGSDGEITCFSFHGSKTLTAGEGGAIVTDLDGLASDMRLYRGQGMDPDRRYRHDVIGFNYRMTNIQAAIGLAQLERFDEHVSARKRVAAWYKRHLPDGFRMQPDVPNSCSSRWMVAVEACKTLDACAIRRRLEQDGVETRPVFPPLHLQPCYAHLGYLPGQFPIAERLHRQGIVLPTHFGLTESDVEDICDALRRAA